LRSSTIFTGQKMPHVISIKTIKTIKTIFFRSMT
jgi:hypothetical protein